MSNREPIALLLAVVATVCTLFIATRAVNAFLHSDALAGRSVSMVKSAAVAGHAKRQIVTLRIIARKPSAAVAKNPTRSVHFASAFHP